MVNDPNYNRRFIPIGICILVVAIFIMRLFTMQITDQSTVGKAETIAQLRQTIYPSRGLIYDRNGQLLVYNQPIFDVTIIPRELRNGFDTTAFCVTLGIEREEFDAQLKALKKRRGYNYYTPQPILTMLSSTDIANLEENLFRFPGAGLRRRTLRDYTTTAGAHILGSVGEVNSRDIERDPYYSMGDYSGRDGIEKVYEKELRGQKGVEVLMRDNHGQIRGSYRDGELDQPATAGNNLTLTLDIRLQQMADSLLAGRTGSVVAIEPATGEILALASSPAWDPHDLVGRKRSTAYNALLNDPQKPILNRATQSMYPPGSTFKTVQALVCLEEGGINENTLFPCSGPQSSPIKCTHHHGSPVALEKAIEQSCNPYFYYAYKATLERQGAGEYRNGHSLFRDHYDQWREDIMSFGIGQKFTDTDLPVQESGKIPTKSYYDRVYRASTGWKLATIRSNSIGQGEVLLTPLQMANQAAAIANEGYYITPHLLRTDTFLTHRHETNVSKKHFHVVKEGMNRVMNYGTGRWHNIPQLDLCGKTGTAQNSHGKDHALFIGFAPKDNPKIAVAVIVENAGFGATHACPIAVQIMKEYLKDYLNGLDKTE